MASINVNEEYNAYEIVYKALNKPIIQNMFTFEDGILTVEEATQEQLEEALKNYDHQAYLNSIKTQPTQEEILRAKLIKDNANMQLQLAQQQKLNADILLKIANLGGTTNV